MSTDDDSSTYVVQVYSTFAPPELRPLLVRLERDATVADCVQASINKFLQRQPLMVLPSDTPTEYGLSLAGGDGYPMVGSHAFDAEATLRTISSLEFPFMLCLTFTPLKESDDRGEPAGTSTGGVEGAPDTQAVDSKSKRATAQHKTLTALEKQALAKEIKEKERVREENLRIIERRRLDKEREAYQHCESYEVIRREQLIKEKRHQEMVELERELKEQEEQMRAEAAAEAASTSSKEQSLLQRHRKEMEIAVEEERQRAQELLKAKEDRIEQARQERERALAEKKRKLSLERDHRMAAALDSLIDGLHSNLAIASTADNDRLCREQFDRKDVERMEADLRNIASLEERRHAPKEAERESRFRFLVSMEEYAKSKQASTIEANEVSRREEAMKFERWLIDEGKRKEALIAQLELEYRSRESHSAASHATAALQ